MTAEAPPGRDPPAHDLRRRLDDLIHLVSDWVWETDADLRLTMISPRVRDLLGIDPGDLLGRGLLDIGTFVGAEGRPRDIDWRGPFRGVLFRMRDTGGRTRVFSVSGLPMVDTDGGAFWGVRGTAADITEQVRIQKALGDSEARYRAVVEGLPELICRFWPDGTLTFANRAYCQFFGGTQEQLMGQDFAAAIVAEDRARVRRGLAELTLEKHAMTDEYRVLAAGGEVRWLRWTNISIGGAGGRVAEFQGVGWDITEHLSAEEALRASEQRYRHFAADAAHELRTPLAVLRSNLDSLDDQEIANEIRQDVEVMARMVEQLLAVTRLEGLAVNPDDRADLHAICTRVAAYLAPIALKEERSIEVVGVDQALMVMGKTDALEMAVRNLVENAIKYSARGTTVTLRLFAGTDPGVSVIDHGAGVPADKRQLIFKRFHRADRRSGGAGLGLSIVERTVFAHGGTIEVGDAPTGQGACFTARFQPAAH